jgi:hypothetical protein
VRSPPLRGGGQPGSDGLAGKTRGQREGRFSRRDAVSAPGWQGRRRAGVWRDYGRVGERPVAEWGDISVGVMPSSRACRARPSEGGQPGSDGLAGKTRGQREGRFSRRDALCASEMQGRTEAEAQHDDRGQKNAWWPRGHMPRSSASVPLGRAEPAPPRGVSQGQTALRGKPGDNAKGDFLGGTRSARPRGKAGRRPRHVVIMDELATGEWPNKGDISVGVMPSSLACGARPSEARAVAVRMAWRGRPGDNVRGGFSEGRALRVRVVRLDASRGTS